ncbi:hypothetical protein JCM16303_000839 [Sporobolomyces ruberrimus]
MSDPITITRQLNRQRSPSRPGRAGTISPTNSFDPAFAPPFRRSSLSTPSQSSAMDVSSTPPEETRVLCAKEVGERLRTLSSSLNAPLEILHLPPLLSLLPSHVARDPSVSPTPSPVEYTTSSLPSITPLSRSLHRALHFLRPVTPLYAITPYHDSFNWSDLELQDLTREEIETEREWYIVAFRSKRRERFTEEERELLYRADREAHEEAIQAGGLLCYWYGSPLPITPPAATLPRSTPSQVANTSKSDLVGRNLATCIWESRAAAILAMRGEKHRIAAQLASRSYESYTLERYLLRKESGSTRVRVTEWKGKDVVGVEY